MSPLQYGYVSNGLVHHPAEEALELLAEHGYDGVALTLGHADLDPFAPGLAARTGRLRMRLEALGLTCVIETGAPFLLDRGRKHFPTLMSEGRERRVELLCRAVDVAAGLGAAVVSIWSGTAPDGRPATQAWDLLAEGCARVLDHARGSGVVVAVEPEPGMLVERLADYELLRRRLGNPAGLGLTLDVGHVVCLETMSVEQVIRRGAPTLAHVHLEDMRRGVHEHLMFGDGVLELAGALAALGEVDYDGLVAVELSRHAHVAHEVVPRAIGALRAAEPELVAG